MKIMMACGHAANSVHHLDDGTVEPACFICSCFTLGFEPDLTDRVARCGYYGRNTHKNECPICTYGGICRCERPSSTDLAFFGYHPDKPYDEFYCGCWGWD